MVADFSLLNYFSAFDHSDVQVYLIAFKIRTSSRHDLQVILMALPPGSSNFIAESVEE